MTMRGAIFSLALPLLFAAFAVSAEDGGAPGFERFGAEQARRDAEQAVRAGDFHFYEVTGGDAPGYPLLATDGFISPWALWEYSIAGCGYRPPVVQADAACEGGAAGGAPCAFVYDLDYLAAYNTAVYNHLKRHPNLIRRFAMPDRDPGVHPEFPRRDDGVFADSAPESGVVAWILAEQNVPLCMIALPDGWTVAGNLAVSANELSFPGLFWARMHNPARKVTVSILMSLGSRVYSYTPFSGDPKDLRTPESYEPFHTLRAMSAWQLLGIYVEPLARAFYPGFKIGAITGTVEAGPSNVSRLPTAELAYVYTTGDGVEMEEQVLLSLWDKARGNGADRYWGIELMIMVSKPKQSRFGEMDALAILDALKMSPEMNEMRHNSQTMAFSDSERPEPMEQDPADMIRRIRGSGTVLVAPRSGVAAVDAYTFPPLAAERREVEEGYTFVNAVAEALLAAKSLYPPAVVEEWRKATAAAPGQP